MNEQELNVIRERLDGAMPMPEYEPTPKDEIWMIDHLIEIVKAYRQDVPALLAEVDRLKKVVTEIYAVHQTFDRKYMAFTAKDEMGRIAREAIKEGGTCENNQ
jgi:hypothetical protein